jgi:phosphoribosylaminoimidazolecarboxamide formyltransferase/IMP cyclohydrolase
MISVSDKTGVVDLAKQLTELGIELISTGGTAKLLAQEGIPVMEASEVTGFPECLDGRVKTLHPKIHGGILAIRDNPAHMEKIKELGIQPIDYIIINLYPFKETVMKPGVSFETCIENIDIGGPSMLRAAAKNHHDVTVVTDPMDYALIIDEIRQFGHTTPQTRFNLAKKVFEHTAAYDTLIADYFLSQSGDSVLPDKLTFTYEKIAEMRYGENPHQKAAFYKTAVPVEGSLATAEQLNGKELSYNNIADTDACISLLKEFDEPTVVAVKHANPCGVGSADTVFDAWTKAFESDQVSIYGGIVSVNREIDEKTAEAMSKVFLEVIVAPSYSKEAQEILMKKKNLRILLLPAVSVKPPKSEKEFKKVIGGILVQDSDSDIFEPNAWSIMTEAKPGKDQIDDLVFGMKVVKHVKSNAIVLIKNKQTIGIGPGQPNRVTSAEIAIKNAKGNCDGAILASDAFFPFSDTVETAIKAGVMAIIQPGGSIHDDESIAACNKNGIPMVATGMRHFKH